MAFREQPTSVFASHKSRDALRRLLSETESVVLLLMYTRFQCFTLKNQANVPIQRIKFFSDSAFPSYRGRPKASYVLMLINPNSRSKTLLWKVMERWKYFTHFPLLLQHISVHCSGEYCTFSLQNHQCIMDPDVFTWVSFVCHSGFPGCNKWSIWGF